MNTRNNKHLEAFKNTVVRHLKIEQIITNTPKDQTNINEHA